MGERVMTELTNMVMVYDEKGRALVQERRLRWKGLSFPGGHVEPNESFMASAIREIKEETGLAISGLELCGVVDWLNTDNGERYLVFCYKTNRFSGELLAETEEGRVFWMERDELMKVRSDNGFERYLEVFLGDCSEVYGQESWSSGEKAELQYL